MRGKVIDSLLDCAQCRITPAYAGKRFLWSEKSELLEDHPRVCGEKLFKLLLCPRQGGSPPRMRGKVDEWGHIGENIGITPAYAGKSLPKPAEGAPAKDHPRVCGEK